MRFLAILVLLGLVGCNEETHQWCFKICDANYKKCTPCTSKHLTQQNCEDYRQLVSNLRCLQGKDLENAAEKSPICWKTTIDEKTRCEKQ